MGWAFTWTWALTQSNTVCSFFHIIYHDLASDQTDENWLKQLLKVLQSLISAIKLLKLVTKLSKCDLFLPECGNKALLISDILLIFYLLFGQQHGLGTVQYICTQIWCHFIKGPCHEQHCFETKKKLMLPEMNFTILWHFTRSKFMYWYLPLIWAICGIILIISGLHKHSFLLIICENKFEEIYSPWQ